MTEQLHFHFSLSYIGEGNVNPLQYSCLENPRDGGAWWVAVYGVAQSQTRLKRLSSSTWWFLCLKCLPRQIGTWKPMIWMGVGELKTLGLLLGQDLKILSLNILEKNSKTRSCKSKLNKKSKRNHIWGRKQWEQSSRKKKKETPEQNKFGIG